MPISDVKVLLLNVNREGWHSGNMIYDMRCIQHACDTTIYGPGWPNYKHTDLRQIIDQIYGSGKPDVIYSYFTPNEPVGRVYIDHYKIPSNLHCFPTNFQDVNGILKIFGLSDFWSRSPQQFSKDLFNSSFSYCFCCFTPPYSNPNNFYSYFNDNIRKQIKFVAHPRCIDSECFKDYGLPKRYDIITVGAMGGFYPFRIHMHNYLSGKASEHKIKYKNYTHCGSNFRHSNFVRENYARGINESKMLASCGGAFKLAMNKIFESMACHTIYVGQKFHGAEELHLKDGFNYLEVNIDNLLEKTKEYIDNDTKRQEMVKNAYKTFLDHHTIEKRAEEFVGRIKAIL